MQAQAVGLLRIGGGTGSGMGSLLRNANRFPNTHTDGHTVACWRIGFGPAFPGIAEPLQSFATTLVVCTADRLGSGYGRLFRGQAVWSRQTRTQH